MGETWPESRSPPPTAPPTRPSLTSHGPTVGLPARPHRGAHAELRAGPAVGPPARRQRGARPHDAAAAAALRGPGLRGGGGGPARLHHAPADPRLQGQCHVPGERQPERGAQPPPGRAECHPGAPAGASGRLGPAAERCDHLPEELQAAGEAFPHGETDQLHPAPVLPPRLPPLPQRHSPELLRGDPQQDSVPQLPRPQRHLGAALARRAPGGRLRPGTADEIPHNHPGPAVFPQHHLCQHPAGSERQDRKSQRPIARSTGAGADPGEPRPAGHGPGHLPVHRRELLAWAAGPCHPMDRGDGPVIFLCIHQHPAEAGDRPIISPWSQGMDPSSSQGSSNSPWIHHHQPPGEAGPGSIIPA